MYICSTLSIFKGFGLNFNQDLHFSRFLWPSNCTKGHLQSFFQFTDKIWSHLVPVPAVLGQRQNLVSDCFHLLQTNAFSTLHCASVGTLGGVPFEVFVQIPAQIVKPSETLRELARRLRFGQNVSNMVETGANWCKRAISGRQCIAMAATVLGGI